MSVKEYALKFTVLSKYVPSLVTNPIDLMNRLMTRESEQVEEECRIEMLVDDIDISLLMVFSQQIEQSKIKKEKKRSRIDKDGSDGHGHSKNRQMFSGQGYANDSKNEYERVPKLRPEGKNEYLRPTFPRCGKNMRVGVWPVVMVVMGGESGHKMQDFPKAKDNVR